MPGKPHQSRRHALSHRYRRYDETTVVCRPTNILFTAPTDSSNSPTTRTYLLVSTHTRQELRSITYNHGRRTTISNSTVSTLPCQSSSRHCTRPLRGRSVAYVHRARLLVARISTGSTLRRTDCDLDTCRLSPTSCIASAPSVTTCCSHIYHLLDKTNFSCRSYCLTINFSTTLTLSFA